MCWITRGLCWLPVFLVTWSSCSFLVSYLISVHLQDADVIFPYISDTVAQPPESCIFGLMTFISAFAGTATIYARRRYVDQLMGISGGCRILNCVASCLGMTSCLGMCIVATFPETTIQIVHYIGALLFFIPGVLYLVFQSIISFKVHSLSSSHCVCRAQVVIAGLAVLALFPTVICRVLVNQTDIHRDPKDKDYPLSVTSAVFEWIMTFSFIFFFLTYICDFKLFTLRVVTECGDEPSAYAPVSHQQQEYPSAVHS